MKLFRAPLRKYKDLWVLLALLTVFIGVSQWAGGRQADAHAEQMRALAGRATS